MRLAALAGLVLFAAPARGEQITLDTLHGLDWSSGVVIVGEVHDNFEHHLNQARVIEAVGASAVVFEMFALEDSSSVSAELYDCCGDVRGVLDWDTSGWPPFDIYAPVFLAAYREGAAVYGAEVSRDDVREAFGTGLPDQIFDRPSGLHSLERPFANAARFGLDSRLAPEEQALREADMAEVHCGTLPEGLDGFVAAQRLRDAHLADAVLRALADTGGPVVVITGNGHARIDWGVPALLALADPDLPVLSIGQLESAPESGVTPPYDRWIVTTAPRNRPDPCDAFD